MKIVGIVSEFNPFHLGHQALFDAVRASGGEAIVCAMSGNFVQRGSAAMADKFARAEMAIRCGADLVLELPTIWAMATAETFALGGVSMLAQALCDTVAFGSECGDANALQRAAEGLLSPALDELLKKELSEGVTYAAARQAALCALIGPEADLLDSPNNTLAVEYLKAIRKLKVDITPFTIPRAGASHDGETVDGIASASYIRKQLLYGDLSAFDYMPKAAVEVLSSAMADGKALIDIMNTERAILAKLRAMEEQDFAPYDGGGEGLYHRLYDAVQSAATLEELYAAAKTKRYPLARLRRMVLSAYLGVEAPQGLPPYLRVLAATDRGRALLRQMRDNGAPVLTKGADVAALGEAAAELFRRECRWTDQYDLFRPYPGVTGSDWRYTPKMV